MRTFDHFPETATCPVCNTGDDRPCFLATIDGTEDGHLSEGQPIHTDCLASDSWRFNKEVGIMYRFVS